MGRYLELAQRVTNNKRAKTSHKNLDDDIVVATDSSGCEISEICERRPVADRELRGLLEDDWIAVSSDPGQLQAARHIVATAKTIQAGVVPKHFNQVTNCSFCGPVFVYRGFPKNTQSCPWCRNRLKGLPIPRSDR